MTTQTQNIPEPQDFLVLDMRGLCELYENLNYQAEEIEAAKKMVREEVLGRMKEDAEIHHEFTVTRVARLVWSKIKIAQAKEFGAVKEAVDTAKLSKLYKSGAKLPFEPEEAVYPLIKRVDQPEE